MTADYDPKIGPNPLAGRRMLNYLNVVYLGLDDIWRCVNCHRPIDSEKVTKGYAGAPSVDQDRIGMIGLPKIITGYEQICCGYDPTKE